MALKVFHIRVRFVNDELQNELQLWCAKNTDRFIMNLEQGCAQERLHYHIYVECSKTKSGLYQNFLRVDLFKKNLSGKDKDFMFKEGYDSEEDIAALQRYVCKGYLPWKKQKSDYKNIACKGFVKEDLDLFHYTFWQKNDALATERKVEKKEKKEKELTFVEKCVEYIKSDTPRRDFDFNYEPDQRYILNVVMKLLGKLGKGLDMFIVRRHVYGVFNKFENKQLEDKMFEGIFQIYSRE